MGTGCRRARTRSLAQWTRLGRADPPVRQCPARHANIEAMGSERVTVRVAGPNDLETVATLRALWDDSADYPDEAEGFAARFAQWLATEGDRRTIWLAAADGEDVGMA